MPLRKSHSPGREDFTYLSFKRKAFTLPELVVTVVILGILTVAGSFGVSSILSGADAQETRVVLQNVRTVQTKFAATYGTYTPHMQDLAPETSAPFTIAALDVEITDKFVTENGIVSIAVGDAGTLGLAALTPDERCFIMTIPAPNRAGSIIDQELEETALCEARSALPRGELPVSSEVSYIF
jgi:prepilin-type N-terminal cleavage/methylation domain-containing protein